MKKSAERLVDFGLLPARLWWKLIKVLAGYGFDASFAVTVWVALQARSLGEPYVESEKIIGDVRIFTRDWLQQQAEEKNPYIVNGKRGRITGEDSPLNND